MDVADVGFISFCFSKRLYTVSNIKGSDSDVVLLNHKAKAEPDEDVFIIPLMASTATKLRNVSAVGNYAINIEWEDGHSYGMYNWHYLRVLCEKLRG